MRSFSLIITLEQPSLPIYSKTILFSSSINYIIFLHLHGNLYRYRIFLRNLRLPRDTILLFRPLIPNHHSHRYFLHTFFQNIYRINGEFQFYFFCKPLLFYFDYRLKNQLSLQMFAYMFIL